MDNNKLNSTEFVQMLEQDLKTLEEKSKEYFFSRLLELFEYKEIKSVVINSYASLGVEMLDPKTKNLVFVGINQTITTNHNSFDYHLIVHDNENKIHLLLDVLTKYDNIYKKIQMVNNKYVVSHKERQMHGNEARLRIKRDNIDLAKKEFFSPEHYQRHVATEEKNQLDKSIASPSVQSHRLKV